MSKLVSKRHLNWFQRRSIERLEIAFMERLNKYPADKYRFVTLTGAGVSGLPLSFDENKKYDNEVWRRFIKYFRAAGKLKSYFFVRTNEGTGVIHFVYTGKSIWHTDLSRKWSELIGNWNVSISTVDDFPGIMRELAYQRYRVRYSYSKNWKKGDGV